MIFFLKTKKKGKYCHLTEDLSPQLQLKLLFISDAKEINAIMSRGGCHLRRGESLICHSSSLWVVPAGLVAGWTQEGFQLVWSDDLSLAKTPLIPAWKNIYESSSNLWVDLVSWIWLIKLEVSVADSQEGSAGGGFITRCWQKSPEQMTLECLRLVHNGSVFHKQLLVGLIWQGESGRSLFPHLERRCFKQASQKREQRHERHGKVRKVCAFCKTGVLSGSPRGRWMSGRGRLLPLFLRSLHASLHRTDGSLVEYVPEFSVTFSKHTWARASRGMPTVRWVTRFSFQFPAGIGVRRVRWWSWKSTVHLHPCFTSTHFTTYILSFGSEWKNTRLFTEFSHILE